MILFRGCFRVNQDLASPETNAGQKGKIALYFLVMRLFACAILPPLLLLALAPQSAGTFPIPGDMHETWPGAKLSEADKQLLQKALNADLRDLKEESQSSVDTAEIALGRLGKGVIVLLSRSFVCGTGGCPIYAYVREKAGYRKVVGSLGWAFAVVDSHGAVPDLVLAGNAGGARVTLHLFRYDGKTFSTRACEMLASKTGDTPSSWWDPSQVKIEPCGQH
jgi:hypothetical protein